MSQSPKNAGDIQASSIQLTSAEEMAFDTAAHYVASNELCNPPEQAFFDVLPEARNSILHRLMICIFREAPSVLESPKIFSLEDPQLDKIHHSKFPDISKDTLQRAIRSLPRQVHSIGLLPLLRKAGVLLCGLTAIHGFGRFRLAGPVIALYPREQRTLNHPVSVVDALETEGVFHSDALAEEFRNRLDESVANLTLSRLATRVHSTEARENPSENPLIDAAPRGADIGAALERIAAIEEAPTLPIAKIRRGMDPISGLVYGPEFTDSVELRFVALRRDSALQNRTVSGLSVTAHLFSQFEGLKRATREAVSGIGELADYAIVPVHPWQYHHTISTKFSDQFDDETMIPLSSFTIPATPLVNLRTLVPWPEHATTDHPTHLKLPINIRKTNYFRTLPTEDIHNGPRVSDLIQSILSDETLGSVGILEERAGICYQASENEETNRSENEKDEHLGVVTRRNPYDHPLVADGHIPVTAASLLTARQGVDKPLVIRCIDRIAETTEARDQSTAARRFLERYVAMSIPFQIRLMSKYGVALESHLQNTLIILDSDTSPVGILVRDFGSIRVLSERLAAQGRYINLYPDSVIHASDREGLYRKTNFSFLQRNIGELIAVLARHTTVREADYWKIVRQRATETFDEMRHDGEVPASQINLDEAALFSDKQPLRSQVTNLFTNVDSQKFTRNNRNPLVDFSTGTGSANRLPELNQ